MNQLQENRKFKNKGGHVEQWGEDTFQEIVRNQFSNHKKKRFLPHTIHKNQLQVDWKVKQ